ncbi:MAG: FAD-dependent oxidoreductase [Methanomassiliicoccales archaeon]|jgi:heterodisulfide reductase subunit A|nr:FAD-dependent oxidoreductase [Methanomassiliicoccales archaeon]MDD1756347.1 FAD-dependent oxidoreductase [Methanomassiliicoccales archaeon]
MNRVAIIGGGVAGLSAAISLERRGVPSIIVEREEALGGLCGELGCKGVERCVRCDVCLARDMVAQARSSPLIERLGRAELRSVSGQPGDFRLAIRVGGQGHRLVRAAVIVCATGGEPFDAHLDKRLGYDELADVVTSLDLERQLSAEGRFLVPSTSAPPKKVAFILCVGSRDERFNTSYCSKACCKYSFKLAQGLRAIDPGCAITIFFMDWRLYDPRENVRAWASGDSGVRLVRSRPAEVLLGEDSRPEVRFASEKDAIVEVEAFDAVVLSVGLRPARSAAELARTLQVETDAHGFLRSPKGEPCASTRPGVFLAGTCRGPKEIVECVKDGAEAASKAIAFMGGVG